MARCNSIIIFGVCVVIARYTAAQGALHKLFANDALLSGVKKDAFRCHFQRMLQLEIHNDEQETLSGPESCSPLALVQEMKCSARSVTDVLNSATKKASYGASVAALDCKGPDCKVAPMPGEVAKKDTASLEQRSPAPKRATPGPMIPKAFERMTPRKRAAVRAALKKAGKLTPELESFLLAPPGGLKDDLGIPLPVRSLKSAARAGAKEVAEHDATPPSPAPQPDPHALRRELAAFLAANPVNPGVLKTDHASEKIGQEEATGERNETRKPPVAATYATAAAHQRENTTEQVADAAAKSPLPVAVKKEDAAAAASSPRVSTASRYADNISMREAALERKREAAANLKYKRTAAVAAAAARRNNTSGTPSQADKPQAAANAAAATFGTKMLKRAAAVAAVGTAAATTSSWGVFGYLLIAVVLAVGLFVASAITEDLLLDQPDRPLSAVPAQWLALAHGLWRRLRRAFAAARKTLTGHGSDLPMSVHDDAGPVARAVAAASAFLHVFWMHLKDNRGQHIGDAVTAAIVASRRASAGGYIPDVAAAVADRASAGGAPSSLLSSAYYAAGVNPFVASHVHRRRT